MKFESIIVKGISSKGTQTKYTYAYPCVTAPGSFDAMRSAIEWADREYNCEYDENGKPIFGTEYKEFETITSIEFV